MTHARRLTAPAESFATEDIILGGRGAHAIEMAHEGIPLPIIQREVGHAHLGITSIYLQGIDTRGSWTRPTTVDRQ